MCHAIPARVVEVVDAALVRVDIGGVRKEISTVLVGAVEPGEWLVIHVGYALGRMDPAAAEATLAALRALDVQDEALP